MTTRESYIEFNAGNDLLFTSSLPNQKILLGTNSNVGLYLSSSNAIIPSNLNVNQSITTQDSVYTKTLSNISCSFSNISVNSFNSKFVTSSNITIANTISCINSITNTSTVTNNFITNIVNTSNLSIASNLSTSTCSFSNLTITGNLNVTGTTTGISVASSNPGLEIIAPTNNSIISSSIKNTYITQQSFAYNWAALIDNAQAQSIVYSPSDNTIIVTGSVLNNVTVRCFSATNLATPAATFSSPNTSYHHAFIAKYSTSGTFTWIAFIANTNTINSSWMNDVDVDNSGNIYLGFCLVSFGCRFYSANGDVSTVYGALPAADNSGMAFCKYNTNGVFQWGIYMDNTTGHNDYINSIAVNKTNGDVYVGGQHDTNPFKVYKTTGSPGNSSYVQQSDIGFVWFGSFIVKFDTNGTQQWFNNTNSNCTVHTIGYASPYGMAYDSTNNMLYAAGYIHPQSAKQKNISNYARIYDKNCYLTNTNVYAGILTGTIWLMKISSAGILQWVTSSDAGIHNQNYRPYTGALCLDSSNNPIFACTTYNHTAFKNNNGSNAIVMTHSSNETLENAVCVKYNTNGNCLWATSIKGTGGEWGMSASYNSVVDRVMFTGCYNNNTIDVYSSSNYLKTLTPVTSYNNFFVELDNQNGYYINHLSVGATSYVPRMYSKGAIANSSNWYIIATTNLQPVFYQNGSVFATMSNITSSYNACLLKVASSSTNMKLLNNLGATNVGFTKDIYLTPTITLLIRDSNDMTTISSNVINTTHVRKIWTGSNWF